MRQAVGVAVFFGMLGVTLFGLIFTPIFYMIVRDLADPKPRRPPVECAHRPHGATPSDTIGRREMMGRAGL